MNTNNGVKWRRFIVPKKVEQINDYKSPQFHTVARIHLINNEILLFYLFNNSRDMQ